MKLFLLVASLVLVPGCKNHKIDARLDELSKIKDQMCACKDVACTDNVQKHWQTWTNGNPKDDLDHDQETRFEGITGALNDCRTHVAEGALHPRQP